MPLPLIAVLLITVGLNVAALLLRPKIKQPKPDAVRDLEAPTAEAGRPMYRVFGSVRIKGLNVLDHREKGTRTYEIKV